MKSDAARLFYMHRYDGGSSRTVRRACCVWCVHTRTRAHRHGGVYADLDFECLRSLDPLLGGLQGPVLAQMGHNTSFEHSLPYVWGDVVVFRWVATCLLRG